MSMDKQQENKYLGRKYTITIGTVLLTASLAYFGKMTPDVGLVFAAAIGSFNYALRNSG